MSVLKEATVRSLKDEEIDYLDTRDQTILIMGPTGAGKSRFIEMLSGDESLNISKDQLDSYTQQISTYELVNIVAWEGPGAEEQTYEREPDDARIFILDTPGFSDYQISEVEILEMVNSWMSRHNCAKMDDIFYLCPITDTRIPGSKRKTIQMLTTLVGTRTESPGALSVVTTMWDRLYTKRARDAAEEKFRHLKEDIWKDLLDVGGTITRFENTHESALELISPTLRLTSDPDILSGSVRTDQLYTAYNPGIVPMCEAEFGPHLHEELLSRITNTRRQKQNLEDELCRDDTQANEELKRLTEAHLLTVRQLLNKFESQLQAFVGPPPQEFKPTIPVRHVQGQEQVASANKTKLRRLRRVIDGIKAKIRIQG